MIKPNTIKELIWEEGSDKYFDIIAQDDDCDYSESGYVIIYDVVEKKYAIGRYSHCSCYGTWSALGDWSWIGSKRQLIKMAKNKLDPDMPERKADPADYDYDHLEEVYKQVLKYFKEK